ncbi:diguanylate cyclase domain-containing protein [Halobacillus seohaensis]|uniref:Diguanylate cyclase domain-containing protein n=1 Tax=Halobacillus seohaensis TaxID=447421 RepID=A0ABW2EKH1_9BACI
MMKRSFSQPITIEGKSLNLGVSIGIALYPQHGQTENKLLNHADEALYKVKTNNKNGV